LESPCAIQVRGLFHFREGHGNQPGIALVYRIASEEALRTPSVIHLKLA